MRQLESNGSGYFSFAGIIPGTYTVDVTAPGFRGFRQKGVTVNPGDTRALQDLKLQVGGNDQSVTVSTSANAVAPEDSAERFALLDTRAISSAFP